MSGPISAPDFQYGIVKRAFTTRIHYLYMCPYECCPGNYCLLIIIIIIVLLLVIVIVIAAVLHIPLAQHVPPRSSSIDGNVFNELEHGGMFLLLQQVCQLC